MDYLDLLDFTGDLRESYEKMLESAEVLIKNRKGENKNEN